jgi:hypothetical protein
MSSALALFDSSALCMRLTLIFFARSSCSCGGGVASASSSRHMTSSMGRACCGSDEAWMPRRPLELKVLANAEQEWTCGRGVGRHEGTIFGCQEPLGRRSEACHSFGPWP